MNDVADEKLVEMFTESGEMRHFDELVRRYTGKARTMIYHMVLNDADADDLTQEVFVRIVNNIHRFRRESLFSTWFYRIAMNTTRGYLMKKSRAPVVFHEDLPEYPDHSLSPDRSLISSETVSQVGEALAELSPSLRSAITLTVMQEMSIKEAAKVEGCLVATMYWRVHEARKFLKKKLQKRS